VFYGFYSVCAVNVAETPEGVNAFFENFLNVLNHSKSIAIQVFTANSRAKVKKSPTKIVKVFQFWDRISASTAFVVKYCDKNRLILSKERRAAKPKAQACRLKPANPADHANETQNETFTWV
jgi:hypothetical protein